MQGITGVGYIVLFGLAIIGVLALRVAYKNRKNKKQRCDDNVNNYELAEKDYKNGMKYKEIADKYGVTINTVKSWKQRYNWTREGAEKKISVCTQTEKSMHTKGCAKAERKSKINWVILENEYVTDISDNPITLKGLSEKYDVSFNTIQDYSADNDWSDKRQKYHRNITEKTREKLSDKTSDVMAQIINNVNSALLQATEELHIHEEVNGFGQLITIPTNTVRTTKLERLVKAITSIQKVELEKEKIEIEKQKHNSVNSKKETVSAFIDKLEELL